MSKFLSAAFAGLLTIGCASAALAAQHTRVRGEITHVHANALDIRTYSGHAVDLRLTQKTHYALVVPARLSDIKKGEFVGIGATGPTAKLRAMEVVIFPNAMRGTGEGHYPWSISATVANADQHHSAMVSSKAPPVQGSMTNGTVTSATVAQAAPPVHGSMTNGTVASSNASTGGKELTITYNNGKKARILVPSDAPVVGLRPAGHSVLKPGAKVFAVASGPSMKKLSANVVAVGKDGLMPPM